ncbi:flagellar hook-length control protein FliK, partial [Pseudokineococcus marinus]
AAAASAAPAVAGVDAAAPTGTAAWVAASARSGSGVADQLVPRAAALRRLGDGVHRVVVRLQPEGLGAVRVVADVSGGSLSVSLHAATEAGHEALRQALPELRRDMGSTAGGSVSLGASGWEGSGADGDGRGAWAGTTGHGAGGRPSHGRPASGEPVTAAAGTSSAPPGVHPDLRAGAPGPGRVDLVV